MQPVYPSRGAARPTRRTPIPPYMIVLGVAGAVGVGLILTILLAVGIVIGGLYASENILPGVTIQDSRVGEVSVSGIPVAEAAAQLAGISVDRPITLRDENRTWNVSSADLGITIDGQATAQNAYQTGRDGLGSGISTMLGGSPITPIYTIDMAKAHDTLQAMSDTINLKPDAADALSEGRNLNIDATFDKMPPNLSVLLDSGTLDLAMDIVEGPRTTYIVQRGEELGLIAKKFNVAVSDIVAVNKLDDADQIYPGQQLVIPAAGEWVPTEKDAPPAPLAKGKAIVVSVPRQRIFAYQDGHLVHSSLMSSGRPGHETVQGDYKVYVKYVKTRMTGPDYDIPDVPWTMYFYQGYGIHGAFWHNNFGRVMSHGCVNLSTDEAKWFFDFAPVGTLVRVIPA
jgi:LysM repeat protein